MQEKDGKKERFEMPDVMGLIFKPSMDVKIRRVNMDNLEDFVFLPSLLYKDDAVWVPPAYRMRRKLLDSRENAFLKENEHAAYLAFRHNLPVGSIICGIFKQNPEGIDRTSAFFSLFEAQEEETAGKLFEAAQAFATERGAGMLLGPWSPNGTQMEAGLLADGFTTPCGYMNAYNPQAHVGYAEENGYKKYQDLYTWRFDITKERMEQAEAKTELKGVLDKLEKKDITTRVQAASLRSILELRRDELKPFSDRTMGYYDEKSSACAFPDISVALAQAHGRIHLFRKPKGDIDTLSFAQVIHSESDEAYLNAFGKILGMARSAGYKQVITAAIPAEDKRMEAAAAKYGGNMLNTYRIYAKMISPQ